MKQDPSEEYLEKAKLLSREEAEQVFSRMRWRLMRRVRDDKISPLEAVAMQIQKEDDDLREWRKRWAEVKEREGKDKKKR